MDLERAFKTDPDKDVGGVEVPLDPTSSIWVARLNNPRYKEALVKFYRQNKVAVERRLMDDNEADAALCRILAETIFVKMKGITRKDKPIKDTADARAQLLLELPTFRELVLERAADVDLFRAEDLAAEGESSPPDSAGS